MTIISNPVAAGAQSQSKADKANAEEYISLRRLGYDVGAGKKAMKCGDFLADLSDV